MKVRCIIDRDEQFPANVLKLMMDPLGSKSLLMLASHTQAKAKLFYRGEGEPGEPFAGPTISNGHWLLARTERVGKLWDKLYAKMAKLLKVSLKHGGDLYGDGNTHETWDFPSKERYFESVVPHDGDFRRFHPAPNACTTWLAGDLKILTFEEKYHFDVRYAAPLLSAGYTFYLPTDDPLGAALLADGDTFCGMIMPTRVSTSLPAVSPSGP